MHRKEITLHTVFLATTSQVFRESQNSQSFVWQWERRLGSAPLFRHDWSYKVKHMNTINAHKQFFLWKQVLSSGGGDVLTHPLCVLVGDPPAGRMEAIGGQTGSILLFRDRNDVWVRVGTFGACMGPPPGHPVLWYHSAAIVVVVAATKCWQNRRRGGKRMT